MCKEKTSSPKILQKYTKMFYINVGKLLLIITEYGIRDQLINDTQTDVTNNSIM